MTCQSHLQCSNTTPYSKNLKKWNLWEQSQTHCDSLQGTGNLFFFSFFFNAEKGCCLIFMKISDTSISFNISFFSQAHFLQDQKISYSGLKRPLFSIQGQYWILTRLHRDFCQLNIENPQGWTSTPSMSNLYQCCFPPFILLTFCAHRTETCIGFTSLWSRFCLPTSIKTLCLGFLISRKLFKQLISH